MQVTIGGVPGAGKTTAAKLVAEYLKYDFYSMGKIRRKLAEEKGLTIDQFNSLPENTDEMVDEYQKKLGREGDNFVNEGRLAFHFMPQSLKIYFLCNEKAAAERIFQDNRSSERKYLGVDEVVEDVRKRMQNDRERYQKYYNVDCYNPLHFDYVIDTTNLTKESVAEEVLKVLRPKHPQEFSAALEKFTQEYFFSEPHSKYINGCWESTLGKMMQEKKEFAMKKHESASDLCIGVSLQEEPPADVMFPADYRGIRVFCEKGSIISQED